MLDLLMAAGAAAQTLGGPDGIWAHIVADFSNITEPAALAAFLLVSRLPVYSGKKLRVRRDRVLPLILAVALFLLLLFSYPWHTLSAGVIAYLIFLPLSARAYAKRAQVEGAKLAEAKAAMASPTAAEDGESKQD